MNLRRNRRHNYGKSNSDYRALKTSEMARPDTMTTLQFLSQPKANTAKEIMVMRERKVMEKPKPLENTQSLYNVTTQFTPQTALNPYSKPVRAIFLNFCQQKFYFTQYFHQIANFDIGNKQNY